MKQFIILVLLICSSISFAQVTDSVKTEESKTEVSKNTTTGVSKWYYGGNLDSVFRLTISLLAFNQSLDIK